RDRMRVRECSKQMREAIESSDVIVQDVSLYYGPHTTKEEEPHPLTLVVHDSKVECQRKYRCRVNCGDADEMSKLLDLLKQSFRRIVCKKLTITCENDYTKGQTVDEITLERICAKINCQSVDLIFRDVFHESVLNFARNTGRRIGAFNAVSCPVDAQIILDLPRVDNLLLYAVLKIFLLVFTLVSWANDTARFEIQPRHFKTYSTHHTRVRFDSNCNLKGLSHVLAQQKKSNSRQ
ncbi:hypothetical protein PFISCL1PPCAC_13268, partial [Pristionchus fissidentatus]